MLDKALDGGSGWQSRSDPFASIITGGERIEKRQGKSLHP